MDSKAHKQRNKPLKKQAISAPLTFQHVTHGVVQKRCVSQDSGLNPSTNTNQEEGIDWRSKSADVNTNQSTRLVISEPLTFQHVAHGTVKKRDASVGYPESNQSPNTTQQGDGNMNSELKLPTKPLTPSPLTVHYVGHGAVTNRGGSHEEQRSNLSADTIYKDNEQVLSDFKEIFREGIREVLKEELKEANLKRFSTTCTCTNSIDIENEYINIDSVNKGHTPDQEKSEEPKVGSCDHVEGPDDSCKCSSIRGHNGGHHSRLQRSSLTNPTYEAWGSDWIVAGEVRTEAIVRRDSESSKTNVKKIASAQSHWNQPSEATHVGGSSSRLLAPPLSRRRGYTQPIACDRECLAAAVQCNVEDIVGRLSFNHSELPDELIGDGCITEDESFDITQIKNRKDQTRILLSLIRGRDLHVLNSFVKHIENHVDKNLADKIKTKFEDNKRTLVKKHPCACCEMKTYVNIKSVSDSMWAIGAIKSGLYSEIAHLDKPNGAQNDYWVRLVDSINNILDKEQRAKAYDELVRALDAKHHYSYIAEAIEASIQKNKILTCRCKVYCLAVESFRENTSYEPASSTKSSFSDGHDSCGKLSDTEMKAPLVSEVNVDAPRETQHTMKSTSFQEPACRSGVERLKSKGINRMPTWPDQRRLKFHLQRQAAVTDEDVLS